MIIASATWTQWPEQQLIPTICFASSGYSYVEDPILTIQYLCWLQHRSIDFQKHRVEILPAERDY